jgi:hypothetical protein
MVYGTHHMNAEDTHHHVEIDRHSEHSNKKKGEIQG